MYPDGIYETRNLFTKTKKEHTTSLLVFFQALLLRVHRVSGTSSPRLSVRYFLSLRVEDKLKVEWKDLLHYCYDEL